MVIVGVPVAPTMDVLLAVEVSASTTVESITMLKGFSFVELLMMGKDFMGFSDGVSLGAVV